MKRFVGLTMPWCRIPLSWGPVLSFLGFSIWETKDDETLWDMWDDDTDN